MLLKNFNYKLVILIGIFGGCLAWAFALSSSSYKQSKVEIQNNNQILNKYGLNPWSILYAFRINEASDGNQFGGSGNFSYILVGDNRIGTLTVTNKKVAPGKWETVSIID